jgi:hypothetical protein
VQGRTLPGPPDGRDSRVGYVVYAGYSWCEMQGFCFLIYKEKF